MDLKILEKLNMTSKETKLYLMLLEYGAVPASTLARKLEENRTSTYSLLNAMQKKGFVSFYVRKKIKYFTAADPKVLIEHNLAEAKRLKEFLPELMAIHNKYGEKPKITFYEGVEGIKQICETLFEVPDSMRDSFMGIKEESIHPEIMRYFEEDFVNRRIEKNITYRGIVMGTLPYGDKYDKTAKDQKRELKFVDEKKFPIKIHIDIYQHNKVALYSYDKDEMMGVIIESPSFYTTMKTAFALAWLGAG